MASNIHHRKPRSRGGLDTATNLVKVNEKHHHAWHVLFQNKEMPAIAQEINEVWGDPDFTLVCVRHRGRRLSRSQKEEIERELRRIAGA